MRSSYIALVSLVLAGNLASASPVVGPITNPANGHDYYLLEVSTWTAAEAEAVILGGHLVTINDAAEHDWIYSTELGSAHRWIGLTDSAQEGTWVWISGDPVTYTRWSPGEPNNLGGVEDYAEMDRNGWNDVPNNGWGVPHQGIVEVVPEGAALVTVCWDGTGDYLTIQEGIDAASDGDEVVLCEGTYTGDGNRDLDFGGKAITVRSTDPSGPAVVAATVIDCQGSSSSRHRGFDFHSGEGADSVLAGITIKNGYAPDTGVSDPGGGGIYCRSSSSPTIDRCVISNCYGKYGGGIHCRNSGTLPVITGCTISGNSALFPGGGGGIYSHWSDLTVTDCTITGNTARFAGGIQLLYGTHTVTNCIITGNSASMSGGGIRIDQVTEAVVLNCRIAGNTASEWGGGVLMYNQSPYDGIVTLVNCEITGNNVTGVGTNGGGGGIRTYAMDNATIVNCTIAGNTVAGSGSDGGGGIYSWGGHPKVRNCILWGNSAGLGDQISLRGLLGQANTLTVSYSDVQGGQAAAEVRSTCTLDWRTGNIDANPSFAGISDYHIQSGSPSIDAGDNAAVPADTTDLDGDGDTDEPIPFDLDGNPRFVDDPNTTDTGNGTPPMVDMGAYEFQGVAALCGNGALESGEECDDGNTDNADGCSSTCTVESGWYCNGEPSLCSTHCGDGINAGTEVCDDGNTADCDGCRSNCSAVEGTCGDGTFDTVCETCDDGNIDDGDGCSSTCTVETGCVCTREPSVCVCVPIVASYPHDRRKNRYISFDPDKAANDGLNIAFKVEIKEITLGSCDGPTGNPPEVDFCREDRGSDDCKACSAVGNACINLPIDCAPSPPQACDPTGETCVNDAPNVGGTNAGRVWWVGSESPLGNGVHLMVSEPFRKVSTDWPNPTHAGDCEIVPEARYGVRAVAATVDPLDVEPASDELLVETTLFAAISSSWWADCVGPLKKFCGGDIRGKCDGTGALCVRDGECPVGQQCIPGRCNGTGPVCQFDSECIPPDLCVYSNGCTVDGDCTAPDTCDRAWTLPEGAVNVDDITAALWTSAPNPPTTVSAEFTWVDLHGNGSFLPGSQAYDPPNSVINVSDLQQVISAFGGRPYTFYDPADCPDERDWP